MDAQNTLLRKLITDDSENLFYGKALYICSIKTKFAISCGIVILDKDKLKSDF